MADDDEKAQIFSLFAGLVAESLNKQKNLEALEYAIAAHIATRGTDLNKRAIGVLRVACLRIDQEDRVKDVDKQFCSFCGKATTEVKKVVAGPNVFICNECVDLCHNIVHENKE